MSALLRSALDISRKAGFVQVFLELFSGSGRMGHAAEKAGTGSVCIDISPGEYGNLLNQHVQRIVKDGSDLALC